MKSHNLKMIKPLLEISFIFGLATFCYWNFWTNGLVIASLKLTVGSILAHYGYGLIKDHSVVLTKVGTNLGMNQKILTLLK